MDIADLDPDDIVATMAALPLDQQRELARRIVEYEQADAQRLSEHYFPDATHEWRGRVFHSRDLYQQHLEHFAAGADHMERCFRAANRTGKTVSGAYEVDCHARGVYPDWWEGRRWDHAVDMWVAGKTNESVRDILQLELLGRITGSGSARRFDGRGMIPGHALGRITWRQGVSDVVDTIRVKHAPTGKWSTLGFKTYAQGRGAFEGTAKHFVWCDEEPDEAIYDECLIRLATTRGSMVLTFTPLEGRSAVVKRFSVEEE